MATSYVDIEDRYFLNPREQNAIGVNVIIGNGQTGAYVIFLDKEFITANRAAQFQDPTTLPGKKCLVAATVVDLLDETNWTSVTVEVTNGRSVQTFGPYSKQAAENLDTIGYTIGIHFQTAQP